jgi:hypothetical protein
MLENSLCMDIPNGTKRSENLKRILTSAAIEMKIVLMGNMVRSHLQIN